MLKKTKKGYYVLKEWLGQKSFKHAFSTRKFGSLRAIKSLEENEKIDQFLAAVGLEKDQLVLMEQIHGDKVKEVTKKDKVKVLPGVDGLVSNQRGIVLGVKTNDCLPVLLVDPQGKIIGAVHAGWRGVLNRIVYKSVKQMIALGARRENVLVGIGPHVGPCCYSVSRRRANQFRREFDDLDGMIYKKKGELALDLAIPVVVQLIKAGIRQQNITFGRQCTACNQKDFFSLRGEGEIKGSLLSVISL